MAVTNEILVSLCIYCYKSLTDINPSDSIKLIVSNVLVSMTGFFVLLNFGRFALRALRYLRLYIKKKILIYQSKNRKLKYALEEKVKAPLQIEPREEAVEEAPLDDLVVKIEEMK